MAKSNKYILEKSLHNPYLREYSLDYGEDRLELGSYDRLVPLLTFSRVETWLVEEARRKQHNIIDKSN